MEKLSFFISNKNFKNQILRKKILQGNAMIIENKNFSVFIQ
jgi:hypothetical protein